ncbi:MAG: hypothetical protein JWQ74_1284 [Marmoricola sp.]|nr:hypothetical protein [Marmoricola sp.]
MTSTFPALRRTRWQLTGVVVFAAVSLFLTSLVAGTLAKGGNGPTVEVKALFTDATGLRVGDDVRIAGVRVGGVRAVTLRGKLALVTFRVAKDQPVYDTTVAKIDFLNIMGQRYIGLTKPAKTGKKLAAGSTIPLSRTEQGLDLNALFNAFKPLFELLRPGDVNELADNIVQVLQGQGGALQHLTDQTARITATLADRDQVIGDVVENVSTVMGTLQTHRNEIRSLVSGLDRLTATVADNRAAVGATLDGVAALVSSFSGLVSDLGPTVTRDVGALRGWAAAFARQAPGLAGVLSDVQVLLKTYVKTLGSGSFLNTYVCKTFLQVGETGPTVPLKPTPLTSRRCP